MGYVGYEVLFLASKEIMGYLCDVINVRSQETACECNSKQGNI